VRGGEGRGLKTLLSGKKNTMLECVRIEFGKTKALKNVSRLVKVL